MLPVRKELYDLFKARAKNAFLLGIVKERDMLTRLLRFVKIVWEVGADGIHKEEVATKLGISARRVQDYVPETRKYGFPIVLDRGICRWESGNEK